MRFLAAVGLAGACLATSPILAADMLGSSPPPLDAPGSQEELGSNWYIRGDVGYGSTNQATVVPAAGLFPSQGNQPIGDPFNPVPVTRGNNASTMSADFGLGFGYRVNDWFRVEADWAFSRGPGSSQQKTVYCPEVANAVSNNAIVTTPGTTTTTDTNGVITQTTTPTTYAATPVPYGYQYDFTTCDGRLNVAQYNNTALVMGYVDLGHWWMFSPYIGAGVGLNVNTLTGSLNFTQTDTGATYAGATVTGTAPAIWAVNTGTQDAVGQPVYGPLPKQPPTSGNPQPVGAANWHRSIDTTKYTFAASVAAGVGFQISQSAMLDAAYHITTLDLLGGMKNMRQSISLGVRYNLN